MRIIESFIRIIRSKSTKNRHLSFPLALVLLIVMTACAKSSTEEEPSQAGSSGQIAEAQSAEDAAEEEGQTADETTAEEGQTTDETTAEEGQSAEDAMQILRQADEDAQERYDNLDLNDKASVIEMVQALSQVQSAIHMARNRKIATWDADGKTLSIGQEIRCVSVDGGNPTIISYMKGRKGLVISHYGGDNYSFFYVCDGTLIGKESGHSTGRLDFSGCLPDWKDHPAGETHSIIDGREITDEYNGHDYDEDVEHVGEILKEAEAVLREAGE